MSSGLLRAPARSWRALRRRVLLHRRGLAAVAAAVAVYAGVAAYAAPPPETVPVWTAARDLPSGHVVARGDLVTRDYLPGSVPRDHLDDPASILGRPLAAGLRTGEAVSASDVIGRGWLSGRPGISAVPVRLADPAVADLLRAGDRVDLVATSPDGGDSRVLAPEVEVLAIPAPKATSTWEGGVSGRLVVLGVPRSAADDVASATPSMFLTVLWNR